MKIEYKPENRQNMKPFMIVCILSRYNTRVWATVFLPIKTFNLHQYVE